MTGAASRVWYVAYASNLSLERFRYYLQGGPVPGGSRVYAGCRDRADPLDIVGLHLPGRLLFAGRSAVWGGGIAFHDVVAAGRAAGRVAGRGYLLTHGQLADVVAQETRQPVGGAVACRIEEQLTGLDGTVPIQGGAGLYDTITVLGRRDGVPLVTITHAAVASMTPTAPTAAYLGWMAAGLRQTHGWDAVRTDRYLAAIPGYARVTP